MISFFYIWYLFRFSRSKNGQERRRSEEEAKKNGRGGGELMTDIKLFKFRKYYRIR